MNIRIANLFGISIGRDDYRAIDARISVGFGARRSTDPRVGELPYVGFRFAWNWLPDRTYLRCDPSPVDPMFYLVLSARGHLRIIPEIDSVRWTGRYLQIIKWGCWRRSISIIWKRRFIIDRSW